MRTDCSVEDVYHKTVRNGEQMVAVHGCLSRAKKSVREQSRSQEKSLGIIDSYEMKDTPGIVCQLVRYIYIYIQFPLLLLGNKYHGHYTA